MKRKIFKSLSAFSLILALSAPNFAHATKTSSNDESSVIIDANSEVERNTKYRNENEGFDGSTNSNDKKEFTINSTKNATATPAYAVDIFSAKNMSVTFKSVADYDPDTLGDGSTKYLSDEEAKTSSFNYAPAKDGTNEDQDNNPNGAWYGFDGVMNRITVINRSNYGVKMTVTSAPNTTANNNGTTNLSIPLFLNGDGIADNSRLLNVSGGKQPNNVKGISNDPQLYYTTEEGQTVGYNTSDMETFLKSRDSFAVDEGGSGPADDVKGGRFSADSTVETAGDRAAVVQSGTTPSPNNFVTIQPHTYSDSKHKLGYALVYFDVEGTPNATYLETSTPKSLGTVTLSFKAPLPVTP